MRAVVPGFPGMVTGILIDRFLMAHLGNRGGGPIHLVQTGPAYPADPLPETLWAIIGDHSPRMQPGAGGDKFS